ncbi:hypothetical protein B484DRAFT_456680 [Ochromonadaceae sp. CCMP2298]|nr:hypothetical protein B484DRAFT_456680 [Ochromonadaceae sp. CCMP2298]
MGEDELIPFEACLQQYLQSEEVDMYSTSAGRVVPCTKSTRFSTFPRYMMVKVARYFAGPNWVQQKITARIDVPDVLDLSAYRGGGRQPNEAEMPDDDRDAGGTGAGGGAGAGDAAAGGEFAVSEELVGVLMSMGFSENGCRRAAIATNNADAEVAMNWVMEHMEDEDFNSPPPAAGADAAADAGGVNAEAVAMLGAMGYSDAQTAAALKATDNNIERAADWLFSHMDDLDAAVAEMMGGAGAGGAGGAEAGVGANGVEAEDGEGKYTLMAVISHIGKSTDHGHYVCHIKKNGAWVLFNDEKVGRCKRAPVEYGFMYLYRRDDAPSDF